MKPYVKDIGFPKEKNHSGREWGITGWMKSISKYEKLNTRNANRSHKKGVRQQSKIQIKKELEITD